MVSEIRRVVAAPLTVRPPARMIALVLSLVMSVFVLAEPAIAVDFANDEVDELDATGRIVDLDQSPALDDAIGRANEAGVAVAVVDQDLDGDGASDLAEAYNVQLDALGSRFHTVFVFSNSGYGAHSWQASNTELYLALDDAYEGTASGDLAGGLDAFRSGLPTAGMFLPDPGSSEAADSSRETAGTPGTGTIDDSPPDGGGIGMGVVLLLAALAVGAFLVIRRVGRNRTNRDRAAADLAADRAEIVEQLRANADRVITLGDRVIASGNDELIELYEQASSGYQAVSEAIDAATTAAEVDQLDDRIDDAEWKFSVIEAELDGKPRPDPPKDEPNLSAEPNADRRIDGPDPGQSVPAPLPPARSPRTGRTYPRSGSRRVGSGRWMGGGLGGVLGGVLGDVILGGGLGQPSRRTQRRSGFPSGGGFGFPSSGSGRRSPSGTRSGGRSGDRSSARSTRRSSGTRFPSPGSSSRRNAGSRPSSRRGASGGRTVNRSKRGSSGRRSRGRSGRSSKGGRSF